MGVSQLQREAYNRVQSFRDQVDGNVVEYALYLNNQHPDLDSANRNVLANVIRNANSYGFPQTIVADSNWAVTYDAWAADPTSAAGAINGGVQAVFGLLTGFQLPEAAPAP
jgi:hypothetical protein